MWNGYFSWLYFVSHSRFSERIGTFLQLLNIECTCEKWKYWFTMFVCILSIKKSRVLNLEVMKMKILISMFYEMCLTFGNFQIYLTGKIKPWIFWISKIFPQVREQKLWLQYWRSRDIFSWFSRVPLLAFVGKGKLSKFILNCREEGGGGWLWGGTYKAAAGMSDFIESRELELEVTRFLLQRQEWIDSQKNESTAVCLILKGILQ